MRETTVRSFDDLQRSLRRLDPTGIWIFRGQADAGWDLVPSFYRGLEKWLLVGSTAHAERIHQMEHDLYRKFTQLVRRYQNPCNKWEEVCLAQHYGVPTRLLDWTRHPLAASYFALASGSEAPAAVWCLNLARYPFPSFLGRLTHETAHRVELLHLLSAQRPPSFLQTLSTQFVPPALTASEPQAFGDLTQRENGFLVILDPPHFDSRIGAQKGLFSIYYSLHSRDLIWNHGRHLEATTEQTGVELLHKIILAGPAKREIRTELERMAGMNWHELFPDLFGVGRYLCDLRDRRVLEWCAPGGESDPRPAEPGSAMSG